MAVGSRAWLVVVLVLVAAGGSSACTSTRSDAPAVAGQRSATPAGSAAHAATLHYISNTHADRAGAATLGYNLFDMAPTKADIDALGPGQQALVWLGNLDNTNCTPGFSYPKFTAAVDSLAGDRKVFGYYLSDEPHPSVCPDAVAHIRQRADYIRAKDPTQRSFIVVLDADAQCGSSPGCEFAALRPDQTHVDLIGVDPFVCSIGKGCGFDRIGTTVGLAETKGIPRAALVPVIQVFGQTCNTEQSHYYKLPSQDELRQALARWDAEVPDPVFDFAYTWASLGPACPALDRADGTGGNADLQSIIKERNAR
jgi:hypothetical protein